MGLTLLPDGEFDRGGCALWPGGDRRHRRQPKNLAVLPTLRFGSSLTAPLACSLWRALKRTFTRVQPFGPR